MARAASAKSSNSIQPVQEELVRAELERVCEDKLFRDTTRMKRFLRYVVEETLEGRGDRLKGYVIGVEVFDRPDDFDPQADTIVRVQAGQLRRRLDLYYADVGKDSAVRILVPKGRYAPTFELRQNPSADESSDPATLVSEVNNKASDPRPSLAVITLDDFSTENEDGGEYFADGLSAEIVNALVQFRSLRIVTLTPTVSTTLGQKSVRQIGQEYGADFVLSGSVRRDGKVFRVTVSLIRSETSEHVFSRVFDREYKAGGLFSIQEEIASYTAAAIAAPFGVVNRYNRSTSIGPKSSMDAYNCVLRYYDLRASPKLVSAEKLLKNVEFLTERQPEFALGWAIRALLNNFIGIQIRPNGNAYYNLLEAEKTAKRALKTDAQNPLGYFALYQSLFHRGHFDDADRMIRKSLSLNPSDYSVLAYYAVCLAARGEFETAMAMESAALRLIGRAPAWYHGAQIMTDFFRGKYETIAGLADQNMEAVPYPFYLTGIAAKARLGCVDEAREIVSRILESNPDYPVNASTVLDLWQLHPELAKKIDKGLSLAGLDISAFKSST